MSNNDNSQVTDLQVFNFGEKKGVAIRTQVVNNEPWFVAKDVCQALGIGWRGDTLVSIPKDWKGVRKFLTPGGEQQLTVISEAGMYKLAFRCHSSERADKFTNWVAGEVLPSIRKTGRYELKPRRRSLPCEKSVEKCRFFSELTKWTTKEDEKMVAEMMNVGVKHVHEVVRGRRQSYGVCCLLVEFAKENRVKGVQRQPRSVSRDADMKELMLEFVEFNGEEE